VQQSDCSHNKCVVDLQKIYKKVSKKKFNLIYKKINTDPILDGRQAVYDGPDANNPAVYEP
jgi:hypothetical protein